MEVRFTDVDSVNVHTPIDDYLLSELVSLERAIQPLFSHVDQIESHGREAKRATENSSLEDELTHDEAAAIYLYSMDTGPRSVYRMVNTALRANIRNGLQPWFPYLKLIYTALNKLPSHQTKVWRGIANDVSASYWKGRSMVWFSISSCSNDLGVVERFLDKKSRSTLFSVTCKNGKSIVQYSHFPNEYEVVLVPGTRLKVASKPLEYNGLYIVDLEEMQNPNVRRKYAVLPAIKNVDHSLSAILKPHDKQRYPSVSNKKKASSASVSFQEKKNQGK